jgi:hypothetical protein
MWVVKQWMVVIAVHKECRTFQCSDSRGEKRQRSVCSPRLVAHPATFCVKRLKLPSRLDCLPAVCLAPHSTPGYDGHIPAAAAAAQLKALAVSQLQHLCTTKRMHAVITAQLLRCETDCQSHL